MTLLRILGRMREKKLQCSLFATVILRRPVVGVATTAQLGWETLKGVGGIIGNLASGFVGQFSGNETTREQAHKNLESVGNSVAGPVGILAVIFPSAEAQGFSQIVLLTAIISLSLAVMNILPIPGLDGGRWFTMAIFRLIRKPLTKEREEIIQGTGFLILLALIVLITIADIGKLW
jgi:regulator of sigma E protease